MSESEKFGPFGDYVLTRERFDELPTYSISNPSDVVPGKLWKRDCQHPYPGRKIDKTKPRWQIGGYFEKTPPDPRFVETRFYTAYIAGEGYPKGDK